MKTRSQTNAGKRGPIKQPKKKRHSRSKAKRTQDPFDPRTFEIPSDSLLSSEEESGSNPVTEKPSTVSEIISESEEEPAWEEPNYWNTDKAQLIDLLHNRLSNVFPDLDPGELELTIERALKYGDDLASEYCGAIPKDVSWKIGLHPADIQKLEPELHHLRTVLKEETPTIPKILQSGLTFEEKKRALQLYDILQNTEPYTIMHLDTIRRLTEMIRPPNIEINSTIAELRLQMDQNRPTLERIATAKITQTDKLRAVQLFDAYQHSIEYTEEWFQIQRRIQKILEMEMSSDQEVVQIEAEEAALKNASFDFRMDLKRKIFQLEATPEVKSRLYEMYSDMNNREPSDPRYSDLRDKILWALRLPYQKQIASRTVGDPANYCQEIFARLNRDIYGMQEAKERIVQAVNDQLYAPMARSSILALKGKPGVGKTKLAKTIAAAVGRPFDKISLGGALDATIFKGSDNVWSGATPSLLLQILSRVKCSNAIILLDEIDKLGASSKGLEVQHALLHILDPTQNTEVQDAFLNEFSHDLSNIWFICAMNDETGLDSALVDRLNVVEIPSYTPSELVTIVHQHTFPAGLKNKGIDGDELKITPEAIREILTLVGKECEVGGMRPLERAVNDVISRINLLRSMGNHGSLSYSVPDFDGFPYTITPTSIRRLLPSIKATPIPSYYI